MGSKTISLWIFLLLAAVALGFLSFRSDGTVREAIVAAEGPSKKQWKQKRLTKVMNFASKYGDWPELMAYGAVGLLFAWRARSRQWTKIIVAAMIASTLAGILANASRLTTGRPRPREIPKVEHGWYGPYHDGKLLIGNPAYNSFPSGHTATAVGFAAVFLFARPAIGILLMFPALLISFSRMYLGAHHFSDIVSSCILGLFVAWLVWTVTQKKGDAIAAKIAERWKSLRAAA